MRLVGAEADRIRELPGIVDNRALEDADTDSVRADAETDFAARKAVLLEEGVERSRERLGLAHLAADDDSVVEGLARCRGEPRAAVV